MNRSIFKNTLRSIWKTKGRFLAIFAIIALGSGFFAGVKVTSPDMKLTADAYYKDTHLADLHLKSTVGFSRAEVQKLDSARGLPAVMGAIPRISICMRRIPPAPLPGSGLWILPRLAPALPRI